MNKKEKLATIGIYIAFIGSLIPIFFKELNTIFWFGFIGIGFGFLIASGSFRTDKEGQ